MYSFWKGLKFSLCFLILGLELWVFLMGLNHILFPCLQRKTNIHIIKHMNLLWCSVLRMSAFLRAVIKLLTVTMALQSFYYSQHSVCWFNNNLTSVNSLKFSRHHQILEEPHKSELFAYWLTSFSTLAMSSSAILSSKLCWSTQTRCCSCWSRCSMNVT